MVERKDWHLLDAKDQHVGTIHYTHVARNIDRMTQEDDNVIDPETGESI